MKDLKEKYENKRKFSKYSKVNFLLTYEEYLEKAKAAGITCASQIGIKRDQYQLSRYKDRGHYTVENCRFITKLENMQERNTHYNHSPAVAKANKTKVENGTHHFLGGKISGEVSRRRVEEGTHHWLGRPPWRSCNSSPESIKAWTLADKIYLKWKFEGLKDTKLHKEFKLTCGRGPVRAMVSKFKLGWVPCTDRVWIEFKEENLS